MIKRVRKTTLLFLIVTIGTVSSPSFGQTTSGSRTQNSSAPVLKGKNVTVYLEDAEFGILAEKFAYDPNARLVDIQDENPKVSTKNISKKNTGILTAQFVNTSSASGEATQPRKMTPRPLGTISSPKSLLGKPQKPVTQEISFDLLSQIPLT